MRFKALAVWLSLLALCSVLAAPASALAQDLRSGKWIGLCGASPSALPDPDGHAPGENTHCQLCGLPAIAPGSGLPTNFLAIGASARVISVRPAPCVATIAERPTIRAPPVLS